MMISVKNVSKYYGKRLAVDNISFDIDRREIVGFLGPNAAGKTTTMRMLTGFLAPTEGDISIAGFDMLRHSLEARQHIGYLPEAVPLYGDMTVRSYLEFCARVRGLDGGRTKTRVEEVVAICHLEEYLDSVISKLSKGFRQRVGVAQAIVHEPEVLILDEPTIGIDPLQVAMTRELIRDLGKERTILISTHILAEVTKICQRVIILNEGKIVAEDRLDRLSSAMSGKSFRLEIIGPSDKVIKRLHQIVGIDQVSYKDSHYLVECAAGQDPRGKINEALVQSGWTLLSMENATVNLEDIFLKLTGEEKKPR
jgi:ABC-2 type transport system ATP-binding protein